MREKEQKIIITFETAFAAIRMEKLCKKERLPGRLIPVPVAITAGCGLAWCVAPTKKEEILIMMEKEGLEAEGVYEMAI